MSNEALSPFQQKSLENNKDFRRYVYNKNGKMTGVEVQLKMERPVHPEYLNLGLQEGGNLPGYIPGRLPSPLEDGLVDDTPPSIPSSLLDEGIATYPPNRFAVNYGFGPDERLARIATMGDVEGFYGDGRIEYEAPVSADFSGAIVDQVEGPEGKYHVVHYFRKGKYMKTRLGDVNQLAYQGDAPMPGANSWDTDSSMPGTE